MNFLWSCMCYAADCIKLSSVATCFVRQGRYPATYEQQHVHCVLVETGHRSPESIHARSQPQVCRSASKDESCTRFRPDALSDVLGLPDPATASAVNLDQTEMCDVPLRPALMKQYYGLARPSFPTAPRCRNTISSRISSRTIITPSRRNILHRLYAPFHHPPFLHHPRLVKQVLYLTLPPRLLLRFPL